MKFTAAQLAAIAAGASAEAVAAMASIADPTAEQLAAEAAAAALAAAAETEASIAAAAAAATAATEAAVVISAAAAPNPLVAHLTAQLADAQTSLIAAKIEAAGFKAAAEAQDGLLAIARSSLSHMNIALGGTAAAADTFTAGNIAAEHARMSVVFKDKFRPGGVAAVAKPAPAAAAAIDPIHAEMLKFSLPQ